MVLVMPMYKEATHLTHVTDIDNRRIRFEPLIFFMYLFFLDVGYLKYLIINFQDAKFVDKLLLHYKVNK